MGTEMKYFRNCHSYQTTFADHTLIGCSLLKRISRAKIALLPVLLDLSSCTSEGILSPKGPIGSAERTILIDATAIMLAVIVPVIMLTIGFAWWFRAGNRKAKYLPNWEYSGRIELIIWSVPALIIMFLGGIAWIGSHQLDPSASISANREPIDVEVVSLDWKWLFLYPKENVASVNQLVVPVGVPIHFRLTSASVMNSFFIPALGSQIYTMPKMVTELNLLADKAGVYQGLSAQFSGDGFSDMRFQIAAVNDDQYRDWIGTAHTSGRVLDGMTYSSLATPSGASPQQTFAGFEPDLFATISSKMK